MKFNALIMNPFAAIGAGCFAGLVALTSPMVIAQPEAPHEPMLFLSQMEELGLTDDQESQLATIRSHTRAQLDTILTAQQRAQLRTTMQQGGSFREAVAAMNLSTEQREQIRATFQTARQQSAAVLTDSQRQQLRQFIREQLEQTEQAL